EVRTSQHAIGIWTRPLEKPPWNSPDRSHPTNPFCSAYNACTAMPPIIAPAGTATGTMSYNARHGFPADGATGADPQGSRHARAVVLARLLAREGPQGRVSDRLGAGVRAGRLARHDHSGSVRRLRPRRDRGD